MVDQGPGLGKWKPANYSGRFYGPSTLRLGIEKSRNVMTVRLAEAVGMDRVVEMASRFGIDRGMGRTWRVARRRRGHAAAADHRLCQLVNGGKRIEPALIERIQDRHGRRSCGATSAQCPACAGRRLDRGPADAAAGRPARAGDLPAARLPDGQPAPRRHRARHGRARPVDRQADRRQDRHLQRQPRCLVHRLHPGPGGRRLYRLRPAEEPGRPGAGRVAPRCRSSSTS